MGSQHSPPDPIEALASIQSRLAVWRRGQLHHPHRTLRVLREFLRVLCDEPTSVGAWAPAATQLTRL